jgi:circadian clock protein KaiB
MKKSARPTATKPAKPPDPDLAVSPAADARFHFQLYITGNSPRSAQAVANLRALCQEHLDGRYDLEIIDLYQQPGRAAAGQIIASPTLLKILPRPLVRMVGNLADREQLMIKLDLSDPLDGAGCPIGIPSP